MLGSRATRLNAEWFSDQASRVQLVIGEAEVILYAPVNMDFLVRCTSLTFDKIRSKINMKRYYLHNGTDKEGPFEKEELRAKVIKPNTPVWTEGMNDWTEASKVDDLRDLFSTPPPFKPQASSQQEPRVSKAERDAINAAKDRRIGRYMRLTAIAIVIGVVGYVAFDQLSHSGHGSTYQEKVMTVEEVERASPERFLVASGTWNENFWGNRLKIHGTVTSKATVAKYKDVRIRVRYLSATETILGTDDYLLYEFVPAHSTVNFEWTIDKPNDCEKLGWDVVSATPVFN